MTDHDLSSLKRDLTIARRTCSYTGITHIISGLVESLIDSRMDSDFSESEERARAVVELLDAATEESGSPTILRFSGDCLTICLEYGFQDAARALVARPWTSVDKSVTPEALLQFMYNCSLVHLQAGDVISARRAFLLALSVPAQVPSIIQVTAMRKLCFLDMIIFGKVQSLPLWVAKANPTIAKLAAGLRSGDSSRRSESEKGSQRPFTTVSRHSLESLRSNNPDAKLPSDFETVLKPFGNSPDDLLSLIKSLGDIEQELKTSTDWGIAQHLPRAWRRVALERLSTVYRSVPTSTVMVQACVDSPSELSDLIDYYNRFQRHMNRFGSVSESEGFIRFGSATTAPSYDTLNALGMSLAACLPKSNSFGNKKA